jgi:hypothetical protein
MFYSIAVMDKKRMAEGMRIVQGGNLLLLLLKLRLDLLLLAEECRLQRRYPF